MEPSFFIACHECDLLNAYHVPGEGEKAVCARCGALLISHKKNSLERSTALCLAGLILFVFSNIYPLIGIESEGIVRDINLIQGVVELKAQGMWGLSTLVFLTCILIPLLQLTGLLSVLLPLAWNRFYRVTPAVFRYIRKVQPWGMMEVYMLGILVSVVKLAKMATIVPGIALYSFAALILVLAGAIVSLDPHLIWEKLDVTDHG